MYWDEFVVGDIVWDNYILGCDCSGCYCKR